ncbi:uncharacterized protein LOC135690221 isoform X2 [Rhopilema esculentum]|uniref:uncharacterized protein LOC135690221 isoform X2 n=1 Tax=Rhopilema esculentum TaxID=499914 RepID=UPI0031D6F116
MYGKEFRFYFLTSHKAMPRRYHRHLQPIYEHHHHHHHKHTMMEYPISPRQKNIGFDPSPVSSPDLNFSETGNVVKHRHSNRKLRKNCKSEDICSECPFAAACLDNPLKINGMMEKVSQNEVFEWQKDWVELIRANIITNVSKTKQKINDSFDEILKVLEKRRKDLLRKADIEGKKKLSLLKFKNDALLEMMDEQNPIEDVPQMPFEIPRSNSLDDDMDFSSRTTVASIKGLRVLRVGNLHFSFDSDLLDSISKFGDISENLASALHSEAVGLGLYYGLVNEPARFRIVTRNTSMQNSFVKDDCIKVNVCGPDGRRHPAEIETGDGGLHAVTFRPLEAGCHNIHISVNNLELPESPFCCHVYEKEKLSFDQEPIEAYGTHIDAQSQEAWTVQKDGMSALLTKCGSAGALIHAVQQFAEKKHAWKVKFTSACPMVRICLGVSSRTNIIDVDIEHTCDFNLGITKYGPATDRRSSRRPKRRSSIYMRESRTYMVLLDLKNNRLTIVCCETEEGKHLSIPGEREALYPCVFMTHECKNEACPRPVVTFM